MTAAVGGGHGLAPFIPAAAEGEMSGAPAPRDT